MNDSDSTDKNSNQYEENISNFNYDSKDLGNFEWVKYILISTFKVYLNNIFTFILISLIPVGNLNILRYVFIPNINELNQNELNGLQLFFFGVLLITGFFVSILATAALSIKINALTFGKKLNVFDSYISVLPKIRTLFIANLVFFILFFAAALLSITIFGLPLLFLLMVNFSFFNQMILFEDMGPIESFPGSYELVKTFRIRIFFVILFILILLLFMYSLVWIIEPKINLINNLIFSILEITIFPITGIVPITGITTMLIYIDIKKRKSVKR